MDRGEKMARHSPKWTVIAHAENDGVGRAWVITSKQTEAPMHVHRRHSRGVCVCILCIWIYFNLCVFVCTFLSTQATERPAIRLATSLCSLMSSFSRSSKRPLRNLNSLSEYVARPWCGERQSSGEAKIPLREERDYVMREVWVIGNKSRLLWLFSEREREVRHCSFASVSSTALGLINSICCLIRTQMR